MVAQGEIKGRERVVWVSFDFRKQRKREQEFGVLVVWGRRGRFGSVL